MHSGSMFSSASFALDSAIKYCVCPDVAFNKAVLVEIKVHEVKK